MPERARLRLLLGAFGDPGHAFPMIALGARLARRGHEVTLQTWRRWGAEAEAAGMAFAAAPEYDVFPTLGRHLRPYEAVERAAGETRPLVAGLRPDAIVADILTLAPALAGELEGVRVATLVPHIHPAGAPGFPPYSIGARLPRSPLGRGIWRALERPVERGLRRGQAELNETRARLGLPALTRLHGGISDALCLVGTFPQLEYPRRWAASTRIVGPLLWEPPFEAEAQTPPGEGPLVLVAPSTSQDPDHRLLRATLAGLARLPVRVLATLNRVASPEPIDVPTNARLVDWVSYSRSMPGCDLVVCHGGHGTLARALSSGCPVVVCPASGDQNENAARADWAGVGARVPGRLLSPRAMRLAVERVLGEGRFAARAQELAAWVKGNDGAERAAELVEDFARQPGVVAS